MFIKELVSGDRVRLKTDGTNLDLSYITDNIISMSFPATGFEKIYRNNIKEVSKFLNEKHPDSYWIINVSNRKFKKIDLFKNNKIIDYLWQNHKPPSFPLFFEILLEIDNFFKKNEKNVVIVNCLSGKGRTGSVICALLMFLKLANTVEDSINIYHKKRGVTITHPSQIRYLHYFYELLNNKNNIKEVVLNKEKIKLLKLNSIELHGFVKSINLEEPLKLKIFLRNEEYNLLGNLKLNLVSNFLNKKEKIFKWDFNNIYLYKDFGWEFYEKGILKEKKVLMTYHNCDFINSDEIVLDVKNVDPHEIYSKHKAKDDFKMILKFSINLVEISNVKINNKFYFENIQNLLNLI